MARFRQWFLVCGFLAILFGLLLLHVLLPDAAVSYTERRKLAQAPALSGESLLDGTFFEDAEEYLLDQFPLRDSFRALKAFFANLSDPQRAVVQVQRLYVDYLHGQRILI